MSKIHLPIAELKPALVGLGKVISRKSTLPVLQSIKLETTNDGEVVFTATDLDSFVSVKLEQPAQGVPVQMLVPYEDLSRIAKRCGKTDVVTVEKADGGKVLIEYPIGSQMGQEHVESLPVEEYPPVPKLNSAAVLIPDDIRSSLLEAFECASTDETRVILNGAYLDVGGKQGHYVVATDGRHLYSSNSFTLEIKDSLLIPEHKFLGWKEFNNDGEWRMRVQPEATDTPALFQISSRRWGFTTRQIEGNYPNWKQVVPDEKQFSTSVELSPAAIDTILALIPRIPCHDVVNNPIGLIADGKKLMLRGRGVNDAKWTDLNIDGVTVKGKPVSLFINRQFLTKALKFGMSTIQTIDPLTPLRFSSGGKQMIVMPIRSTEPSSPGASTSEPEGPQETSTTERTTTMPKTTTPAATTNGNCHHEEPTKPAIELALEKIELIKGLHREAVKGLNDLADTLKQVQREQKTTVKEVASVRTTLEKLQQVRI